MLKSGMGGREDYGLREDGRVCATAFRVEGKSDWASRGRNARGWSRFDPGLDSGNPFRVLGVRVGETRLRLASTSEGLRRAGRRGEGLFAGLDVAEEVFGLVDGSA